MTIEPAPSSEASAHGPQLLQRLTGRLILALRFLSLADIVYLIYNTVVVSLIANFITGYFASYFAHPLLFQYGIVGFLAAFFFILFFILHVKSVRRRFQKALKGAIDPRDKEIDSLRFKQGAILRLMVQLSHINAGCDRRLFDLLHNRVLTKDFRFAGLSPEFVDSVERVIIANVIAVLDNAARVFRIFTGHECAAAVKRPFRDEDNVMMTKGLARDTHSDANRSGADDGNYLLANNTAFDEIWNKEAEFYLCNDLLTASQQNKYTNPRKDWQKDYNATIVLPITYVWGRTSELDLEATKRPAAFLCVDNLAPDGNFDKTFCAGYMRFLCWRLSAMIYRYDVLKELHKSQVR
jgi:hypothetical protein